MTSNAELGFRLKGQRVELGITRLEMERITGIGRNRLARLERGEGTLTPADILPLLQGYQLRLADWLAMEPNVEILKAPLWLLTDGERKALIKFVNNLVSGRAPLPE